jgi:outer membrane translocation and assembly module TamA
MHYAPKIGSVYEYTSFVFDARKYFNPWYKHIIAIQGTTTATTSEVPFYEMAMLGGDNQMRGYYKGAFRDRVLVDGQVEYRMPVWGVFGITTWIGVGRVAHSYSEIDWSGFKVSYGTGFRVRVDSKNNTNLRVDFGFGPNGISGTYINFTEAF